MDDFAVQVRQIAQYPFKPVAGPQDAILIQQSSGQGNAVGGPYMWTTPAGLFRALAGNESLSLGILPAPDLKGLVASFVTTPLGLRQGYNFYVDKHGTARYLQNGVAGMWSFADNELRFSICPTGARDAAIWGAQPLFRLGFNGQLQLAQQIQVGRNPGRPNEVVTLDYLERHTVASFNGRIGDVRSLPSDIYSALGLDGCDPLITAGCVDHKICEALNDWYYTNPMVFSFNNRVGTITLTADDITAACTAPGALPRSSTPPPMDDSSRIATTAFVQGELFDLHYNITNEVTAVDQYILNLIQTQYAPLASPVLTGIPTAPTAAVGSSTAQIATTAFVMNAVAESVSGVATFNGRSGNVVLDLQDVLNADGAPIDSPAFTGTPTAPSPSSAAINGEIATCAWVLTKIQQIDAGVASWNGRVGIVSMTAADITGAGGALLASPAFTGTPTAPTPGGTAGGTQIATVAYVQANAGVSSFNGRGGAVTLTSNDLSAAGGALLAGPAFTGTPTAPTAAQTVNNTQLATTAYVRTAIAAVPAPHAAQGWSYTTAGAFTFTTPNDSTVQTVYKARWVGGGGAGGGVASATNIAACGGGGAGIEILFTGQAANTAINGTVGTPGASPGAGGNGGAGGTTSITIDGVTLTATGGGGGWGTNVGSFPFFGGNGGTVNVAGASANVTVLRATPGEVGSSILSGNSFAGRGGSSMLGFGGCQGPTGTGNVANFQPNGYGAGGGGGWNNGDGGWAGTVGAMIIERVSG